MDTLLNISLTLAFPALCLIGRAHPKVDGLLVEAMPWAAALLNGISIYNVAFRRRGLSKSLIEKIFSVAYFFVMFWAVEIVLDVNIKGLNANQIKDFFVGWHWVEIVKGTALKGLLKLLTVYYGIGYFNKIPKLPLLCLWVIMYSVSGFILGYAQANAKDYTTGLEVVHPRTFETILVMLRNYNEPLLGIFLAGLLTLNFEIELLLVSCAFNTVAVFAGMWGYLNFEHWAIQSVISQTQKLLPWNAEAKLQASQVSLVFIAFFIAINIHFGFLLAMRLSKKIGRIDDFLADSFSLPSTPAENFDDSSSELSTAAEPKVRTNPLKKKKFKSSK